MSAELSELLKIWDRADLLERILEEREAALLDPARPFVVAGLARRAGPLIVVVGRSREAEALVSALAPFLGGEQVWLFPAWEVLPGEAMSPTLETMGRRIKVAHGLNTGVAPRVIVASVRAFVQQIAEPKSPPIRLSEGTEVSLETLSQRLVELGFERNYLVERPGEFSVRGGILDIFPPGRRAPVRSDFFGDEISSLQEFSVGSQRSREPIEEVEILPVRELLLGDATRERAALLRDASRQSVGAGRERLADLERLAQGLAFPGMEAYLGEVGGPLRSISSFLREGGAVILLDPQRCRDRCREFLAQAAEWAKEESGSLFADFDRALGEAPVVELWPYARAEEAVTLEVTGWGGSAGRPEDLVATIRRARSQGAAVAIAAGRAAPRAREILAEAGLFLPIAPGRPDDAVVSEAAVERGFLLSLGGSPALALIGEADLFGRRRPAATSPSSAEYAARGSALLLELAPGDYLVHETYGVGRYHGMVTRELMGVSRDYLLLEYAAGDRLYVPTEQLGAVTRYSGGESPKLNRLGTNEWERTKSRARRAVKDIAEELVALYVRRSRSPGYAFSPDTFWQRELEDAFPHIETPDQERAIAEVKADMEAPTPMDRLVCGDVGYGKTEVAVRAAFKAVQDSKQVAVLVPTTILAQQHHQTFSERFAPFPIRVAPLSRFLSDREQADVLESLAAGKVDVVIGTHRLLQRDVKFHDLGLLVIDEEQRFGVAHKEALKRLRASVDVLTMSATPIPRTLEMAITGVRSMSLVDTPPADRRPVLTYVGAHDQRMVTAAIRRELAREGQVFLVHNRVRSIAAATRRISELVPDARVGVAHGQLSEAELERVMLDVWDGRVDLLVCTTIIESGLDIPAMNTLIVERADRLGLAQLYQLRGRVGRARERAYAYLFYPHEAALTDEAHERLKTLSEFTELGSGFKIALRDLEIRGAGNLLGAQQSGHIAAVGFDLYVKMMSEAVASLTGLEPEKKLEVRIDLPTDAFIPASYIARESLRIETYRRIEKVREPKDAEDLGEELQDLYGALPDPVRNLLKVAELRAFLADLSVSEVTVRDGILKVRPLPPLKDSQEVRLRRLFPGATYKEMTETLLLPAPAAGLLPWVLDSLRIITAPDVHKRSKRLE